MIGHRPRQSLARPATRNAPTSAAASPQPPTPAPDPEATPHVSSSPDRVTDVSSPATRRAVAEETAVKGAASDAPSPQALLAQWYRRYPDTFFKGHTRPLKVGIHQDLAAREPWPEKLVRRALAGYVNLPRYLKAVREGGERIDLEGQAAGTVDAQAADHARQKLERLQAGRADHSRQGSNRGETPQLDPTRKSAVSETRSPGDTQSRHESRDKPAEKAPAGKRVDAPPRGQKPTAERPSDSHATLEDKLSALLAKHNRQG
ncbi:ProQ/FinO family protein [Halomonas sp. TRM85114]|nr:ProQ/FinO family protein [Halomonas jincaotanensis]